LIFEEFLDNRHDQSILSIMRKKRPDIVHITEDRYTSGKKKRIIFFRINGR